MSQPPGPYYQPPAPPNQPPWPPQQPSPQQPSPQQSWPPQQPSPQQSWPPQQPGPYQPQGQWAPGPQQPWPQPPAPARVPGPGLGTHLKRAVDWNLAQMVPTPREDQTLAAAGVEPRLRGMLVWRRSALLVAFPILLLSAVLGFIDAADVDTSQNFTGFGKLWPYLPAIALLFGPLGALRVVATWTEMRRNTRFLIVCWVLSIAIPLLVALFPLEFIVDVATARGSFVAQGGDVKTFDAEILSLKTALAVAYALTLLPVVVTIPGGVLKGAARIKSLFPAAALPGWFLVAVAPFYSLFTIVVFVLIDQIIGDAVLLLGVGLLAFSPWLFVIFRKTYGRPLSTAEAATELPKASRFGGLLFAGGLVLIAVFLFHSQVGQMDMIGSDDKKAFFTYLQVGQTLIEVFGRMLVTTVVFSAIVLSMVFAEWRTSRSMRPDIRQEHETQMQAIERYMASPTAPDPSTWVGGPAS